MKTAALPALMLSLAACQPAPPPAPATPRESAAATADAAAGAGAEASAPDVATEPAALPDADPLRCAQMAVNEPRASGCDLPADVLAFLDARANCEHWLGEPDYDADRRRQITEAVNTSCTGLDARLDTLKAAYRSDRRTQALLAGFEKLE